ncbi:Lrp/AsnC ligand binding domain-containing protein [Texcoconibacillus texcoconensis]|uniref:DNA-binding Lrp family transcriptional regulator n=1 Tax=Texcoconibacillus texcoconensis TaxID=1095777 RepID=A0A840QNE8_9BACI|nr:DNA-binding Lrp family transcriptional regulator [Texcoconibacillus texcoconensis]
METKEKELLKLLEKDGRQSVDILAKMLDMPEYEVSNMIERLEEENVIVRYAALVDWTKIDEEEKVTAMIDVKVTPKRGVGFDEIADRIVRFPEVQALYLMSGTYDLSVVIEASKLTDVARFVSDKLSTLDSVESTTTHFQLKRYKHDGAIFSKNDDDDRMVVSP